TLAFVGEDEQHAGIGRHRLAVHQAELLLFGGVGDFEVEGVLAELYLDGGGVGRRRGGRLAVAGGGRREQRQEQREQQRAEGVCAEVAKAARDHTHHASLLPAASRCRRSFHVNPTSTTARSTFNPSSATTAAQMARNARGLSW